MRYIPNFKFKKYWQYYTVLAMVVIYALTLIYFAYPIDEISINKSGVFGDSFGVLTALFSGLAFAGIIISIKMQSKQLRLQRKELRLTRLEVSLQREELTLTRKEVRGQKKELKYQNKTMKKQAFEHTFFQMLAVHYNNVKDITYHANTNTKGRSAIKKFYEDFKSNKVTDNYQANNVKDFPKMYQRFYENHKYQIAYYFSNIFHVLDFINSSTVKNKKFYTDLLRAQLSEYELKLISYHGISEYCENGFKSLIEEYSILKNLLYDEDEFLEQPYSHTAFTDSV